jgi:hypothetical protein
MIHRRSVSRGFRRAGLLVVVGACLAGAVRAEDQTVPRPSTAASPPVTQAGNVESADHSETDAPASDPGADAAAATSGTGRFGSWGGHLKLRGAVSWIPDDSVFQSAGNDVFGDGYGELRIKNQFWLGSWGEFETHYELATAGGDTWTRSRELSGGEVSWPGWTAGRPPSDERRLLNLTWIIADNDRGTVYHRLDRLCLTWRPAWGTVRVGRQAVSWGNGMIFNPMDIFNPFAPTDFERDYKVGDDLLSVEAPLGGAGSVQVLAVPRREPSSGDVRADQSSLAGKWHFARGTTEFDLMAAAHYGEAVLGGGAVGYAGGAAWRVNVTWTRVDDSPRLRGFWSAVANLDYSWTWGGKNSYGFVEAYYNGLGGPPYTEALADPALADRLLRGELYTLGRMYLDGGLQVEVHPLCNLFFTAIVNADDPSAVFQPRAVWDAGSNLQFTVGANLYAGARGSEFGGIEVPGSDRYLRYPATLYVWLTRFF